MCMWPLWVRIKHLDGWVNQLKKNTKKEILVWFTFLYMAESEFRVTVALSGRAQFLRHPAHSRRSRTPRWRCRTGSDSELWSEPHRWRRHSDWTTTGCRLEKVTKMKKCMIFLLNTDLKVGVFCSSSVFWFSTFVCSVRASLIVTQSFWRWRWSVCLTMNGLC